MEELKQALEIIEGEAECLINYEDFQKVMNMIDEIREIFNKNK